MECFPSTVKLHFVVFMIGLVGILAAHSIAIYDLQKSSRDGALFTSGQSFTLMPNGISVQDDPSTPPAHDQIVGWHLFQINDAVPDVVERVFDGRCVFVSKALVVWYRDSGAWVWPYLTPNDTHVMHCWGNKSDQHGVTMDGAPTHWVGVSTETFLLFRLGGNL